MDNSDITLKCMNGFTLHIKGANLIVEAKRKEDTYPISKIQSFSLKEPRAISPGSITFRTAQAASSGVSLGLASAPRLVPSRTFSSRNPN